MAKPHNPKHIGIIMDGNRRFARRLMLEPWKGHEWGKKKVEQLVDWCSELDIKELTLYAFSMQNFNRPKAEFDQLMEIFKQAALELLEDERLEKKDIRVRFLGRIHLFPEEVYKLMEQVMKRTEKHNTYTINFCMAYGGREEIIDAIKAIQKDIEQGIKTIEDVDEENFNKYLYLKSQPEIIIRTGGERRTSNFLPWQGIYAEWFFLEKKWPEFDKDDLIKVIDEYMSRERRFGK